MNINIVKQNADYLTIKSDSTIKDALEVIENGQERICFVVDNKLVLKQVVSDGDIRRAFLKDLTINDKIDSIHDRSPVIVREGCDVNQASDKMSEKITILPILNSKNQIKGIIRKRDIMPFIDIRSREILIVGMGYVGLTLALVLADNNFSVIGYDNNKKLINDLLNKKTLMHEKGIDNFINTQIGHNLSLVNSLEGVNADIHIISVGTPINKDNYDPIMTHLNSAVESVAKILKKSDLVILRSTVPVGCTREIVLPLLEKKSGLEASKDFFLAFCPERTIEGRALEELRKLPQIVSGLCKRSTELASRLFSENTHTVVDVGSLEAAEMAKLIDNTYRDTIFSYSNQMALISEKVGVNLPELIDRVNLGYERNKVPKPSPGVGGPCLSKDPYILNNTFIKHGLKAEVSMAAREVNENSIINMFNRTQKLFETLNKNIIDSKIFLLGFAFKGHPETNDLRDSTTVDFLNQLINNGAKNIFGFDPVVPANELEFLNINTCSIEEGFNNADAVFIMNNHRSFSELKINQLADAMNSPAILFDCWHTFQANEINSLPNIIYSGIGIG